jgi:hypothetical protein
MKAYSLNYYYRTMMNNTEAKNNAKAATRAS